MQQEPKFGIKLFLILRCGKALKKWKSQAKNSKTRYLCLKQLVTTQADYLRDLQLIHTKIRVPFLERMLISKQQDREMFPNFDTMINLSQQLLKDVSMLKDEWHNHLSQLAPVMIRYSTFLLVYGQFFKSYMKNQQRFQELIDNYEEVRDIESAIMPAGSRRQTFENLYMKPFQRPLKYKLILKQYQGSIHQYHIDNKHLGEALLKYQQVNQRNNKAMENKQKSEILIYLQAKYGSIIDLQAKYFIDKVNAMMVDIKVCCYFFSNMMLVVSLEKDKEVQRIIFNDRSFYFVPKDLIYFKNRLYICGKRRSIQLHFGQKAERDKCLKIVREIINKMYKLEYTRRELSTKDKKDQFSKEQVSECRVSYTQLKPKLPKPPRFLVIGQVKRQYSAKVSKIYFIIKFLLPFGLDNCSSLYVQFQQLLSLQRIMRTLYPQEFSNVPFIEQISKEMPQSQMKANTIKSLEYKSIYVTIFLNFIFRNAQISKRTDIIAYRLKINEPMWIYCKYSQQGCKCKICVDGSVLSSIKEYDDQAYDRGRSRIFGKTFYCPFRTIHAQNMLTHVEMQNYQKTVDRLFLIKCEKHLLDYRLLDSLPFSFHKKKISIEMDRISKSNALIITIDPHLRVQQIIELYSQYQRLRLEDYELFAVINHKNYMLGRDEVLWRILDNQSKEETGGFFTFSFKEKQNYAIRLTLKKVWVLETVYEISNCVENDLKRIQIIQQFMFRIKEEQITMNFNNLTSLYAAYYVFKSFDIENVIITQEQLKILVSPKKWSMIDKKHRMEMLEVVREKSRVLREKYSTNILQKIWEYIHVLGKNTPGWSAFLFDADLIGPKHSKITKVKVGVDIERFYIKQTNKIELIYEQNLEQVQQKLIFSSFQLRIIQKQVTYTLNGDSMFNLEQIIDTFLLYRRKSLAN